VATSPNQLAKTGKFGDLRRRLVFLLLALVVYRIGAHIPVPGINPHQLQALFQGQQGGILSLFNMFSGARCRASRCSRWGSCRTSRPRSSCS
jgi:preprotein translocase subunit SecY